MLLNVGQRKPRPGLTTLSFYERQQQQSQYHFPKTTSEFSFSALHFFKLSPLSSNYRLASNKGGGGRGTSKKRQFSTPLNIPNRMNQFNADTKCIKIKTRIILNMVINFHVILCILASRFTVSRCAL